MGHGYVASEFKQFENRDNCILKFYVPIGEYYDAFRTTPYIWNHGEAISEIEVLPEYVDNRFIKCQEIETDKDERGKIETIYAEGVYEHLLHSLSCAEFKSELNVVNNVELTSDKVTRIWDGYEFKVFKIGSVQISGTRLELREPHEGYIVTPSMATLRDGDPNKNTVFRLSWLIDKIFELRHVLENTDPKIQICWFACRTELAGEDSSSITGKDGYKDDFSIHHIYPE